MRVRLRNKYDDKYGISVQFPKEPLELYDMLDRLGVDNDYDNVYMRIDDDCIPKAMRDGGFYDDIFKLNLLAQRLEQLTPAYTAGFTAVLYGHEDYNLDDLILVTYGLEAYPIYPCRDYAELGEVVIDNDMIPEVENCPDELIPHLDKSSIGRLAAEKFRGTFVGRYYCEVADYEPPDMSITIAKPPRNEFQILIGADEETAQWCQLPYEGELSGMEVYGLRSPLPKIQVVDDIAKLNEVAEKLAVLGRAELIKLKAVMESNCYRGAGGALMALDELDHYEFDASVNTYSEYGREYLSRYLPDDFDTSIMDTNYLCDVGSKVLERKSGEMTSYGVLSGVEQRLYSALIVQEEEEICDEGLEMGAIQ
ncbi:MAG: hypothetical protein K6A75_09105 [Ruminococcus sp.]|nr:hypothetical protein [Ruminococcus sp.]